MQGVIQPDELGELPIDLQPKLLRALETRRIATERGVGNGHRSHHPIDRERLEEPAQRDEADAAAWALREWLRKGGEAKVAGRTTNGGVYAQKRVPAPPLTPYQWSLVC